jgi:hypothetical protein
MLSVCHLSFICNVRTSHYFDGRAGMKWSSVCMYADHGAEGWWVTTSGEQKELQLADGKAGSLNAIRSGPIHAIHAGPIHAIHAGPMHVSSQFWDSCA